MKERVFEDELKMLVPEKVFEHSVRTARTAKEMAAEFHVDVEKASLVGLLHDCAKGLPGAELIEGARSYGIAVSEAELAEPYLLHAPVGAEMVRIKFGVQDPEILSAIRKHTVGAADMSSLDKIAYIADMIEPGRDYPGLDSIRRLARDDLDACYAEAYAHTLEYLVRSRKPMHPTTISAWNAIVLGGSK